MSIPDNELSQKLKNIRLAVFDVDGVMTDGRLYYTHDGQEIKAFHAQDGLGIKRIQRIGVQVALITGRSSAMVTRRASELGIAHVFQGCSNKLPVFQQLLAELDISADQSLYVGDDVIDLEAIEAAGVGVTVPNAHSTVLRSADWVAPRPGGLGAVRDICDAIVDAQT